METVAVWTQKGGTFQVNATTPLPGFEDLPLRRTPTRSVPALRVEASDDSITRVAGAALWGPLLDRLGLEPEADRRKVRPIGRGGYSGGECYRALCELLLAGGEVLSDISVLADPATTELRGSAALPSHTTAWRFLAGADLGRVARLQAVNREMLRRAWALGARPQGGLLTIDPDATVVRTYGRHKEGSTFTYLGKPGLHPLVGVLGETGEVLGVRARGGSSFAGRGLGSFVTDCIEAIPAEVRDDYQLWVRSDSAGYQGEVVEAAEAAGAVWSLTAKQNPRVKRAIYEIATSPDTEWTPAQGGEEARGSEVAEAPFSFAGRPVRLVVRRQPKEPGAQLSLDDLDGYRFRAVVTNVPPLLATAAQVEAHHRLRGGTPEDTIKALKGDFGFSHAPLENFFGNWCWWLGATLAHNVALWLRILALPEECRSWSGKRLRLHFLNLAARLVRSGRRLILKLPRAYRYAAAFREALRRLRALPAFG